MSGQKSNLIKMLRSGGTHGAVFSPLDQLDMLMKVSVFVGKDNSRKISDMCQNDELLDEFKKVLLAGQRWMYNPTCIIFMKDGEAVYDKSRLAKFIQEKGKFSVQELDVHRSFLEVVIPIEILLINIDEIDDEIFLNSPAINVHTFMGKVKIK